jgi:diguanylate cyclase (GGDEF)-like protein
MFLQLGQFPPLQRLMAGLERLPRVVLMGLSLAIVAGLASLNILVLRDFSFILLYLIPVAIASWFGDLQWGLAIALLSALGMAWINPDFNAVQTLWNAFSIWGVLAFTATLINTQKVSTEMEKQLLRTDPVTGAINRLFFAELLEAELQRASRYGYALTLAVLTLNGLSQLRAQQGGEAEEGFLFTIIDQMSESLRANDVVSRLSGHQFAILLSQTDGEQATQAFARLEPPLLKEVKALEGNGVTYCIAVTTFDDIPDTIEELLEASEAFAQAQPPSGQCQCVYQILP